MPDDRAGLDKDLLLKAFEVAQAWSSQIVTLSTGVIVFTGIFLKDVIGASVRPRETGWLWVAWVCLGLSAVSGIFFLSSLTALLNRGRVSELDVYSSVPRWMALLELAFFILGLAFFAIFVLTNVPAAAGPSATPSPAPSPIPTLAPSS